MESRDPVTGLSPSEETSVRQSWALLHKDWPKKHGVAFFVRLFQRHPRIRSYFRMFDGMSNEEIAQTAELCSHVINFSNVVTALTENLGNSDILVGAIHKLAKSHYNRGISPDLFDQALAEFVDFLSDTPNTSSATVTAWKKTTKVVASVIRTHMAELKAGTA